MTTAPKSFKRQLARGEHAGLKAANERTRVLEAQEATH